MVPSRGEESEPEPTTAAASTPALAAPRIGRPGPRWPPVGMRDAHVCESFSTDVPARRSMNIAPFGQIANDLLDEEWIARGAIITFATSSPRRDRPKELGSNSAVESDSLSGARAIDASWEVGQGPPGTPGGT